MAGAVLISQNAAQNSVKKCKVTLSISECMRDYAKENNLNMSSILETALKSGDFIIKNRASLRNEHRTGFICENHSILDDFSANVEVSNNFTFARACDSRFYPNTEILNADFTENELVNANHVYTKMPRVFSDSENNAQNFVTYDSFINYSNFLVNTIMTKVQNFNPSPEFIAQILTAVNMINAQMNVPPVMLHAPTPQVKSIAEYFAACRDEFKLYALENGVGTKKTLTTYVNCLSTMAGVTKPSDLTTYKMITGKPITKNQKMALSKLFRYMRFVDCKDEFNGYPLEKWHLYLDEVKIVRAKSQSRQRNISTEALREAVSRIHHKEHKQFLQRISKLMYYSGARFNQLMRLLEQKEKEIVIDGDICIVSAKSIQIGEKKKAFNFYFPAECADFIRNCNKNKIPSPSCRKGKQTEYTHQWMEHTINKISLESSRITASNLRKFNYNVYRVDCKIPKETADMLQSRTSEQDVGDKHYLSQDEVCREAYHTAVKILRERLPWE